MELIVAMFILAGWYAYKHFQQKKKKASEVEVVTPAATVIEEVEVEPPVRFRGNCDFCQGSRYLPGPTNDKMPCPKCRRGKKIS